MAINNDGLPLTSMASVNQLIVPVLLNTRLMLVTLYVVTVGTKYPQLLVRK